MATMFPHLAKEIVEKSKTDWNNGQKRAWDEERHLAIAYEKGRAEDDYLRFIDKDLRPQIPTPSNNITKRVNDRVSLVYMVPPKRTLGKPEDEFDMTKYNMITRMKDLALQVSERKTNLLGLIGTKLTWMGKRDGFIDYSRIIDFEPFFGDDPMRPIAVMFPLASNDSVSDVTAQRWQYWDDMYWATYEDGKVIDQGDNEYGFVPIEWTYRELPDGSFMDADIDRDLVYANREMNVLQLDGDANIRFRSFGEMFVSGLQDDQPLKRSQDIIHSLPEGATISTTSPEDTISSIKDWIRQIYSMVAQNHHLPVDFVEGAVVASGAAVEARNKELNDDRRSDVERWRMAEYSIYEMERKIIKVEAGIDLPVEFSVDFQESIDTVLTADEQMKKDDWDLKNGLTTRARILMRDDPDQFDSEEAAQEYIDNNKKANGLSGVLANALNTPVA